VRVIAVYAGRFDPVTNGHLDILHRAAPLFDHLVVAVYNAPADKTLFSTAERVSMLRACVEGMASVSVEPFDGLLTDFVRSRGADVIVRGLRAVTDFSVEFDQALMYKDMAPEIEQVYLMSDLRFVFVRAERIREVAALGHDVAHLVPEHVAAALREVWPPKP
jgi:pantetheine-phosphate adenylyltransferase